MKNHITTEMRAHIMELLEHELSAGLTFSMAEIRAHLIDDCCMIDTDVDNGPAGKSDTRLQKLLWTMANRENAIAKHGKKGSYRYGALKEVPAGSEWLAEMGDEKAMIGYRILQCLLCPDNDNVIISSSEDIVLFVQANMEGDTDGELIQDVIDDMLQGGLIECTDDTDSDDYGVRFIYLRDGIAVLNQMREYFGPEYDMVTNTLRDDRQYVMPEMDDEGNPVSAPVFNIVAETKRLNGKTAGLEAKIAHEKARLAYLDAVAECERLGIKA